jgi:hypothetical protein
LSDCTLRAGRNWSFRSASKGFEFFWKAESIVGPYYSANRDQLFRYYPDVADLTSRHDEAREELRASYQRAFERVLASPGFQDLAKDVEPHKRRYLAEYLLNGQEGLPTDYEFFEYWSKKGREYLNLSEPALVESWREIEEKGAKARAAITALKARLETLQATLSDEFGLPPVDPGGATLP